MCSIGGGIWFSGELPPEEKIKSALSNLKFRGPDDSFIVRLLGDNAFFVGNRLIIRGDYNKGRMPFELNEKIAFFNGEIYNYKKLSPHAETDGEVILPLFEEYGTNFCQYLDGEYAIVIWDKKKRQLYLFRDSFGCKPIYFSLNKKRIIFGSSENFIQQIEEHQFCSTKKGPNYDINRTIQEPYTNLNGVWSIPKGHYLSVKSKTVSLVKHNHWKEERLKHKDVSNLYKYLEYSLKSRLDYDGVIGIPMSGGIDSGIIAFYADLIGVKYKVFSVTNIFGEETDEAYAIFKRLEKLKNAIDIIEIKFTEGNYYKAIENLFNENLFFSHRLEPGIPLTYTLYENISKHQIRVAIDGTGGDEFFNGYTFGQYLKPTEGTSNSIFSAPFFSIDNILLDCISKVDRIGGWFSIEPRFPFLNKEIVQEALKLSLHDKKWALRKFLFSLPNYNLLTPLDKAGKKGFIIKKKKELIIQELYEYWSEKKREGSFKPTVFPFSHKM